MLRVHHLIESLARGELGVAYDIKPSLSPHPNERLPALLEPILTAHKFALNVGIVIDDALFQTAQELWRAKILKPPFPVTWWELETPRYVEGLLVRYDEALESTKIDIFYRWPSGWSDWGIQASVQLGRQPQDAAELFYEGNYLQPQDVLTEVAIYAMQHLMTACCLLTAKEAVVETVEAPAKLNAKREKSGRPPLFEHRTISVPSVAKFGAADGEHASPRLHWRRGHVRKLPSGTLAGVRPCLVGLAERGVISKDYLVALTGGRQ